MTVRPASHKSSVGADAEGMPSRPARGPQGAPALSSRSASRDVRRASSQRIRARREAARRAREWRSRRRRLAGVALLFTALSFLAGSVLGANTETTTQTSTVLVAGTSYTVRAGDTIWSIASRIAGDRDPRPVVSAIRKHNDLPRTPLAPGTVLQLP